MPNDNKTSKMSRQLMLYDYLVKNEIYGPDDIMRHFSITRRMLQRDLKDLRDCGLINLKYDKSEDRYIDAGNASLDPNAAGRHRQHLLRLFRLGTLITNLSATNYYDIERYERNMQEFEEYIEESKEDPNITPEDIEDYKYFLFGNTPDISEILYDLKSEYYALFPESNERTRQRDFEELRDAGFEIYYSKKYRSFIYEIMDDDL